MAWKLDNSTKGYRQIELTSAPVQAAAVYNQKDMLSYQQMMWLNHVEKQLDLKKMDHEKEDQLRSMMQKITDTGIILDHKNSIFRFNTPKHTDSRLLDYIHGSSPLFGPIRAKIDPHSGEGTECNFCRWTEDSPYHQLLECPEIQDTSHSQLKTWLPEGDDQPLIEEILTPQKDKLGIQEAFISRVEFLIGQHASLTEYNEECEP